MEWLKESRNIFENFSKNIPNGFESVIKPMIIKAAEKRSLGRNSHLVIVEDLILGLFDATPEQFKKQAKDILVQSGVDIDKYINLKDIKDQQQLAWDKIGQAFHPGNYNFNLYITDKCNQNCVHCAVNTKRARPELSKEQWFNIIEELEKELRGQGRRGVYIWFGGEPTCRLDIRELIRYCGEQGYHQAMATNGILFDQAFARYCKNNNMSHVFISLDSVDEEKVNRIRDSKDAFNNAVQAIKNAIEAGIFVVVTTTVMKDNLEELGEIKSFVEKLGAVSYMRAVIKQESAAENWNRIGLSSGEYQEFYQFRYNHTIEEIKNGNLGVGPMCMIFDMVPFMEHPDNENIFSAIEWGVGCQACRSISGIDINGDFFPCDYPSQLKLGNVLSDGAKTIMNSEPFKDIRDRKRQGKCQKCHHINLCGGGCRIHAECESGNFSESFWDCWHEEDESR